MGGGHDLQENNKQPKSLDTAKCRCHKSQHHLMTSLKHSGIHMLLEDDWGQAHCNSELDISHWSCGRWTVAQLVLYIFTAWLPEGRLKNDSIIYDYDIFAHFFRSLWFPDPTRRIQQLSILKSTPVAPSESPNKLISVSWIVEFGNESPQLSCSEVTAWWSTICLMFVSNIKRSF